jgi:membrane-bound lytic murein transglycosylase MltF
MKIHPMRSKIYEVLCVIFSLSFLLLGTGCSQETPKSGSTPKETASPPASRPDKASESNDISPASQSDISPSILTAKWTGDLDGMIQRRLVRVLTTYSKTNFFVDRGAQRGLVHDSFRTFEEDLNKELRKKTIRVHVVFVPVANDDLIPALLEGRGDIVAAGKLITEWRMKQVDFTKPTISHVSEIVVTGPGAPAITAVEDLGGKEVYVQNSEISQQGVARFNAMLAKAGRPPVRIRPAPEVLAPEDILEMVNAGIVPITIAPDYLAEFWRQFFPNLVLHKDVAVKSEGQIAAMVRKGSPKLLASLNAFLTRYPEGSLKRNLLLKKYLQDVRYAKDVTSKRESAKFLNIVRYFKKYGDEYGIDYLLLGAQGYQESALHQNKRSPRGAIGVMQVMPQTGKEMKVGDITKLEPNIHAGVKYIRFMMDEYYANEPMDPVNKALFAFASYNAGPNRIKQMRARAARRGLDPNKWFNNVEIATAEVVGRETVQYVSNIYKYYLAYTLLMEQKEAREEAKRTAVPPKK